MSESVAAFAFADTKDSSMIWAVPKSPYDWVDKRKMDTATVAAGAADVVGLYHHTAGDKKRALMPVIVRKVQASDSPSNEINAAIEKLLASPKEGRIDDAIDILSELGQWLDSFAMDVIRRPEVDDDYGYIIIRAIARAKRCRNAPFLIDWAAGSTNQSLREAAVGALGDLADPASVDRLRTIAQKDHSKFIRTMAQETLEDLCQ